ncbi:MAG TPA: hypothetical protein VFL41_00685 [Gaiellaceae bacterium]|nr:hypothetical protein [Gaiellaceae bacterium]HET8653631.1 hypothetical protein [Gaiellaceae bacterium]
MTFAATSAAGQFSYTWATELSRDTALFTLTSPQPTVVVDGTPPTVAIGDRPNDPSNSRTATFTFSASDPTRCSLDGSAPAACNSPVTYGDLNDGPHTFTVVSTDAAGNSTPDSYAWTIETRSPTAALSSGPAELTNTRAAAFVFSADEPSRFECQLDGGAFLPCSSPVAYQGLADGAHTFAVRPIDGVGNVGAAVSRGWRIDATAPESEVTAGPRSRTTSLSTTFRFAASEQASFQCKLDAAAFAPCASPKSYSRLRRSAHTFQVRGIDPAGNVDPTPAVFRWTVIAAVRRVTAASALLAPQADARVTSPPTLLWRRVARASYYNVQLYRGTRKILSAWPVRTRLRLRAQWTFGGRQHRLVPGTYRWYVWPRLRRGGYGKLLGQSTFIVRAPARR